MANFSIRGKRFEGAYCTVDTFRHLLSEEQAVSHLQSVASVLKKDAFYILGLHLLPASNINTATVSWEARRGNLTVNTTMAVLDINQQRREETLQVNMRIGSGFSAKRYQSEYKLRTYNLDQFHGLIQMAGSFEIAEVYNHSYDLSCPVTLDETAEDVVILLRRK